MSRAFVVTRLRFALLSVFALGCGSSLQTAPTGAVRIHTEIVDGRLFIDAHPREGLADGLVVELAAGRHALEVRRGDAVIAALAVEVRAAVLFDATLREVEAETPLDPNSERRAHYGEPPVLPLVPPGQPGRSRRGEPQ